MNNLTPEQIKNRILSKADGVFDEATAAYFARISENTARLTRNAFIWSMNSLGAVMMERGHDRSAYMLFRALDVLRDEEWPE